MCGNLESDITPQPQLIAKYVHLLDEVVSIIIKITLYLCSSIFYLQTLV